MDKRTLLALVICGLMTAAYMAYLKKHQPKPRPPAPPQQVQKGDEPDAPPPDKPVAPDVPVEAPAPKPDGAPKETVPTRDDIRMAGEDLKYEAFFTNRGAAILDLYLTEFKQDIEKDGRFHLLEAVGEPVEKALEVRHGLLAEKARAEAESTDDVEKAARFKAAAGRHARLADKAPYRSLILKDPEGRIPLDTQSYRVLEDRRERLAFESTFAGGLRVTKEFVPRPGKYEMGVRITAENSGQSVQRFEYEILATARVRPEGGANVDMVAAIGRRNVNSGRVEIERYTVGKVKKGPRTVAGDEEKPIAWAGSSNRYFAAALIPIAPEGGTTLDFIRSGTAFFLPGSDLIRGKTGSARTIDNLYVSLNTQPATLAPGEKVVHEYTYFLGPKMRDVLDQYPDIKGVVNYGMFAPISRLLLSILKFFYRVVPNYGVGIILLTILVKLCLHWLTRKGQVSMHRMQKLQPLIRELQEKYKHDKQRLSREQMGLFRKHNANPMSGCMPIFFQMPVFFGLFRMLQNSVEIRHEGFVFWINDLSSPDTIAQVASFPINILPVLMVASWLIQQSMMPKPADPQQAQTQKMMKFMPIMFGVMLYGMASGLTLYWLTSTFLGIIEQKIIKHEIKKMDEHGDFPDVEAEPAPARAKPQRKGKRK